MNIVFSHHALLKIRQRKLSKRNVITTVKRPEKIEFTYGGRQALYKRFRKHSLKVVVVHKYAKIIIVTAHWVA